MDCLNFEKGSKSVKAEFAFWYETLERWYSEGLECKKGLPEKAIGHNIRSNFNSNFLDESMIDNDVHDYFNFNFQSVSIPNSFSPFLPYETLEDNEVYIIFKDDYGITQKRLKNEDGGIKSGMPLYLDYPIKNKDDFNKYREMYNSDFSKRLTLNWVDAINNYRAKGFLIWLCGRSNGFFWFPRKVMGLENFLMAFYDAPELIHEMLDFILDYTLKLWNDILTQVKVDIILINEDMAYKCGPLLSIKSFREFLMPRYLKLTDFLKDFSMGNIFVDSDGDITELLPVFIECGVNGVLPAEITGKMDIVRIRKDYPTLKIAGGINKMKLLGGFDEIDKELEKVKFMLKTGGYIPFIDHSVPPVISWKNFKYYRNNLNNLIDKYAKE